MVERIRVTRRRDPDSIMSMGDLAELLNVDRSTIWRWRKSGILPPALELSSSTLGWRWAEVQEWIRSRGRRA